MTDLPSWSPEDIDPTRPSVARVYDFYLGGSHNFEADREFGRQVVESYPTLLAGARDNRLFLRRAVRYACADGIDQFLDLGSGIPTVGNVHEVAQQANPGARVVYVDHDPVAVAHGNALLDANPRAVSIEADLRAPDAVADRVRATGLFDPSRPVCVLFAFVLHFVHDDARPIDLVARYMVGTAAGSLLALSHGRSEEQTDTRRVAEQYNRSESPGSLRLRTRNDIEALFGDLPLVDPGVVAVPLWRPELTGDAHRADVDENYPALAGVARQV